MCKYTLYCLFNKISKCSSLLLSLRAIFYNVHETMKRKCKIIRTVRYTLNHRFNCSLNKMYWSYEINTLVWLAVLVADFQLTFMWLKTKFLSWSLVVTKDLDHWWISWIPLVRLSPPYPELSNCCWFSVELLIHFFAKITFIVQRLWFLYNGRCTILYKSGFFAFELIQYYRLFNVNWKKILLIRSMC